MDVFDYIDSLESVEELEQYRLDNFDTGTMSLRFWECRNLALNGETPLIRKKNLVKLNYIANMFGAGIPTNSRINRFRCPHGLYGIFISAAAKLGTGCTIFQQVTIGSNALLDSKNCGAPTIGNNVYIGSGAKIVGKVNIGNNVRIGANCVVVEDIPDNSVVVMNKPRIIVKDNPPDNRFYTLPQITAIKKKHALTAAVPMIGEQERSALENAVKIQFTGDLIMLEDQVKSGFNESDGTYNFDSMFRYAKPVFAEADYVIGVYEGPSAGEDAGYSTSNFNDGKPLRVNYPDEFATAVKNAGIDFVTTANNHLLDKGVPGALRTLKILDAVGLEHIGSYASDAEKSEIKLITVRGIRIAVLAYTYGCNMTKEEFFYQAENSYITNVLASPSSPYFQLAKGRVLLDFDRAKALSPDLIIVLPHMGAQFRHDISTYQQTWNRIFIQAGADIIIGDHAHAVQPLTLETNGGKTIAVANCPGNFANSYIENDGDATAVIEVYISPESKKVIAASAIPMMTVVAENKASTALPLFYAFNSGSVAQTLTDEQLKRSVEVCGIVTESMFSKRLVPHELNRRVYVLPQKGLSRTPLLPLNLTESARSCALVTMMKNADKLCFVGDSITVGSRNCGYGWHEPLAEAVGTKYCVCAWDGGTTKTLLNNIRKLYGSDADTFVIAIGTNDVRYRNPSQCSMTSREFVANIDLLVRTLGSVRESRFAFIAPWLARENDKFSALPENERDAMLAEYAEALRAYCTANGFVFVDPNPSIAKVLDSDGDGQYLVDFVHPNVNGVYLYSKEVLRQAIES